MTTEKAIELLNRISDSQFDGIHGDERREALDMAVRALFSQQIVNDSQGLVNDCISRKMAIDEVKRLHDVAWANWKETRISANTMIDALKDLPSAQPDLDEWCTDCKEYDDKRHCCPRWNRVIRQALKDAQPERKKGKWISEVKGKKAIIDEYGNVTCSAHCSECGDWLTGSDEYACRGRFCPNCGARMEGESE